MILEHLDQDGDPQPRPPIQEPMAFTGPSRSQALVTTDNLKEALDHLRSGPILAWDTETYPIPGWDTGRVLKPGLRRQWDKVIGVSFSTIPGTGYYWDIRVSPPEIIQATLTALADPTRPKVGHNLRFDIEKVQYTFHSPVAGPFHDTQTMAWLLGHSYKGKQQGLKIRAWQDLGIRMTTFEEVTGGRTMDQIAPDRIASYAADDAWVPAALMEHYLPQLREQDLWEAYQVEMELIPVLVEIEERGMYLNPSLIQPIHDYLEQQIAELDAWFTSLAGTPINMGSQKQASWFLFDHCNFPRTDPKLRRADGSYLTEKAVIQELLMTHPQDERLMGLLRLRQMKTIQSHFAGKLHFLVNPGTGRIHGSLNSTRTDTGRFSASEPNMENIPSRGDLAFRIRSAFTPQAPDGVMLVADLSAIEVRIMAHLSRDQRMIQEFHEGLDTYKALATHLFKVPYEAVTKEQRATCKPIRLGTQYGGQEWTMSRQTIDPMADPPFMVPVQEMREHKRLYYSMYPGVPQYMRDMIDHGTQHGYVRTERGKRRRLPDLGHYDASLRARAERQAMNDPIQGGASDIFKDILLAARKAGIPVPVNIVHDEVVWEFSSREEAEHWLPIIVKVMEGIRPDFRVPIRAEASIGDSWATAKE